MITVFKYEIPYHFSDVKLPAGAEILDVAFRSGDLFMWAKVDTEAEAEERNFKAFATGQEIPYREGIDYKFIGTARTEDGLVFHAFEQLGL